MKCSGSSGSGNMFFWGEGNNNNKTVGFKLTGPLSHTQKDIAIAFVTLFVGLSHINQVFKGSSEVLHFLKWVVP